MKKRKVTALLLAASMVVSGLGQTAAVSGAEFTAEAVYEEAVPEAAVEELPAEETGDSQELADSYEGENQAEGAEGFGDAQTWDETAETDGFVSDETDADLMFTDGEGDAGNPDQAEGDTDNPYASVVIKGEMRDGENQTTIFTNEVLNFSLDTAALEGQNYELQWQTGDFEPNDKGDYDFIEDKSIPFTVSEDGGTVTFDGSKLSQGDYFDLKVDILIDGESVEAKNIGIQVIEPELYHNLPYRDETVEQLPRWNFDINKYYDGKILDGEHYNHGWGEEFQREILSVTAENASDDEGEGSVLTVEPYEDGNGWNIYTNRMGHGIVKVTYQTYDGEEADYKFDVSAGDGVYSVDMTSDTETDNILPGKSLTLSAGVHLECYDSEKDMHMNGDVSNVKLRWEYDEKLSNFTFTKNDDGTLTVGAVSDVDEDAEKNVVVTAAAYIPGSDGGEDIKVAQTDMQIFIQNGYYVLTAKGINNIWEYGDTRTLTPELKWFGESAQEGEVVDNAEIRYSVEGDWNWLDIKDAKGKKLTEEDNWGIAPFTVTRKSDEGTNIQIIARLYNEESEAENEDDRYEEVTRNRFWIDEVGYDVWFEGGEGKGIRADGYTWVYNDEDLFVPLNTKSLEGHDMNQVKREWKVGIWNEETESMENELPAETYTISEEGITLHGAKLYANKEKLRDNCGFDVHVRVLVNGEVVREEGFGADVREPNANMDDWDEELLIGWSLHYDNGNQIHYWVENQYYPYGADDALTITKIEVEDLREEKDPEKPVLEVVHEDDEWIVWVRNYGEARLTYTAESEKFGEVTYSVIKNVVDNTYRVGVTADPYEVMLPGTEVTLEPYVWHYMEGEEPVRLDDTQFSIEYRYNEDLFEYKKDGEVLARLKALANEDVSDYVEAVVTIPQGEGEEPVTVSGGIDLEIRTGYERLTFDIPVRTEPGATVSIEDFNGALTHFDMENQEGAAVKEAKLSLSKYESAENSEFLTISEDGQSFTVAEVPDLGIEDDPLTAWVCLTGTVEGKEGEEPETWEKEVQISICNHQTVTADEPPTCTEEGTKVVTCEKCGKVVEYEVYPATGHDYQESITKAATCTEEGVKTHTCKNCGDSYTEAIPKTAHNIVTITDSQPTCGTPGKQHKECSVCHGERTELADLPATGNHTFGAYTVTKAATALAEGTETRTCSVCGATESKTIAKLKATLKLPATSIPLKAKQTLSIKATLTKGDSLKSVKSKKTSVVKVKYNKNGTIKLTAQKKTGTAKVTVVTAAGQKKTITVKVQKATVTTTKITGVPKKLTIKKGKTSTLKPVLSPISSKQKITYTSSNKKVATVTSKGKIKAVKKGKAVITVKSGKKSVKCTVTVK